MPFVFHRRMVRKLASLLTRDAVSEGLWNYDISSNKLFLSPRWFSMLGYCPEELPHTTDAWLNLIHPGDRSSVEMKVRGYIENRVKHFALDYRIRTKHGSWMWVLSRGKCLKWDKTGTPLQFVGVNSDISAQKESEKELAYLAYHDQLTGIFNRKSFYEQAEDVLNQAQRSDAEQLRGFMCVDIDDFGCINDNLGHSVGDALIKEAALRLKGIIRKSDQLFRYSGDEFVIIATKLSQETDLAILAHKILKAFAEPFSVDMHTIYIGICIGIALYPRDGMDVKTLVKTMDAALTEAKREKNTFRFYTRQMQEEASRRMKLIVHLRKAVEQKELVLHYQPQVTKDGDVVGAEALIRWVHPEMGIISPVQFIPLAEETGLIIPIGRWIFSEACRELAKWKSEGLSLTMSVNLSVKQLRDREWLSNLEKVLAENRIDPEFFHIEITESSLMENIEFILSKLMYLKEKGIQFSIDDFGTGYSSLNYLKRLPIHAVKIDRTFIVDLPTNAQDASIVEAVINMAHGLGLKTVAEGVDTAEQLEFLKGKGCDILQGYYFSKPLDSRGIIEYARTKKTKRMQPAH